MLPTQMGCKNVVLAKLYIGKKNIGITLDAEAKAKYAVGKAMAEGAVTVGTVVGGPEVALIKVGGSAGRVFWSGRGAKGAAEAFAKTNGKQTLEMTWQGKLLDSVTNEKGFNLLKPY